MKIMNEHQNRLWQGMLEHIDNFRSGRLLYSDFVGKLEGSLDAGEIKNKQIVEEWYDHWTPLEIERATKGDTVERASVENYIQSLERFIREKIVAN